MFGNIYLLSIKIGILGKWWPMWSITTACLPRYDICNELGKTVIKIQTSKQTLQPNNVSIMSWEIMKLLRFSSIPRRSSHLRQFQQQTIIALNLWMRTKPVKPHSCLLQDWLWTTKSIEIRTYTYTRTSTFIVLVCQSWRYLIEH